MSVFSRPTQYWLEIEYAATETLHTVWTAVCTFSVAAESTSSQFSLGKILNILLYSHVVTFYSTGYTVNSYCASSQIFSVSQIYMVKNRTKTVIFCVL